MKISPIYDICFQYIDFGRIKSSRNRQRKAVLTLWCHDSCGRKDTGISSSLNPGGPFYKPGLTLIPVWISNYIHYKVSDEIVRTFSNFDHGTVEAYEWISNFIPHITEHIITYSCWDLSHSMLAEGDPGSLLYLMHHRLLFQLMHHTCPRCWLGAIW